MTPTQETYRELDRAYVWFNTRLFAGRLPACLITVQRHKKAYGHFWGDTWSDAAGKAVADEIALNPDHFRDRSVAEVLATLVHEMCHLEQHHFGKPSRSGYHNKEWVAMMAAVGLVPSDTGAPGGKKTGQCVHHYIDSRGPFERACQALVKSGYRIPWLALTGGDEETRRKKTASKTKYSCPSCGANAWAKPETALICGDCEEPLDCEAAA